MSARPVQLALGTVQFGLAYGVVGTGQRVADGEARRILACALELGVKVLDTAAAYGDIEERLAGLAAPAAFDIVTKIPPLPAGADAAAAAAWVQAALVRSEQRLGHALQAVLFHSADDLLGPLGCVLWATAAATIGLGVQLGVSCYGPEQLHAVCARMPVAVAQLPGNVYDQRLVGHAFPGVEIHLRSAFLQGLLLAPEEGARRVPAAAPLLAAWQAHCAAHDVSPLVAALGAVKALPGVQQCVVGVESLAQLQAIHAAWQRAVPLALPQFACTDPAVIDPRHWKPA
jgi:aryl-alcohol dehydrogenase-like predicted oxidoreductase